MNEKSATDTAFSEGFKAGQLDREKDLKISISQVREELTASISKEITEAAKNGLAEGYAKGKSDQRRESDIQLREQALAFKQDLIDETTKIKNQMENDFIKKQAEIEQQFCVLVRPYVEIETEKGIIYDTHKSSSGYQYQLMVNGIPVFQPHIIIEKTEEIKEVNEQRVEKLLFMAEQLANEAINAQLPNGKAKALLNIGKGIISKRQKL